MMSDVLTRYRNLDYALPKTYLSWDLFGAGLEHLGRDGKPVELPLRDPAPDEVLLRVDAIGLCFSDTKLIWAGSDHPRIRGRDLVTDPTVGGHEAAMTVVRVGDKWKDRFQPGERYIIQADIYVNGVQKAFGYVQRGAMAQYAYAGPWVLDGDDGCYLLPIQDESGYAEAALVEPWACVESAYHIAARTAPKPGGRLLVVFAESKSVELAGLYADDATPTVVCVLGENDVNLSPVLGAAGDVRRKAPTPESVRALVAEDTNGEGFDDIFLVGKAEAALIGACDAALAKNGHLAFIGANDLPVTEIDIGRVHYHYTRHVGTTGLNVAEAYAANARSDMKPGGAIWMIGAAGPMGQMHVQRALEAADAPAVVFCTDISQERLDYMQARLQPIADRKGVKLVCKNVADRPDLSGVIADLTGGKGFDDVYVHAPVAPLVEQAADFLGMGSVLNVFAGVGLGTMAKLPPRIFTETHTRVLGSSGSSMADFRSVLAKMESRQLATRMSLAALGGIEAAWPGIKGVKENRFPGKTVIYPQITGLDLIAPEDLGAACPTVGAALENGNVWTNEAEKAFLASQLKL